MKNAHSVQMLADSAANALAVIRVNDLLVKGTDTHRALLQAEDAVNVIYNAARQQANDEEGR